ncbi:high mobility group B protein 4-like [Glossina fuscipes]|uniref:High mobility group B protein 4-like n=1 Tax=Glossina fuscipes TaxID=7396 RepID=A0A9C5YZP5_9MUSC|nr:high mobility group B protein 4-like [Glossina fuscipes]
MMFEKCGNSNLCGCLSISSEKIRDGSKKLKVQLEGPKQEKKAESGMQEQQEKQEKQKEQERREKPVPSTFTPEDGVSYQESTAPTAFFVFLYEYRRKIRDISFTAIFRQTTISRCAGKKWRQMSNEEKQPYIHWAKKNREKLRHVLKTKNDILKRPNLSTACAKRHYSKGSP